MNMKLTPTLAVAGAALLLAAPSSAEVQKFSVDPVHSSVGFSVRHLVSKTPGVFNDFSGTVWLDPDEGAKTLRIEGTVQTGSIDTNNEKRDGHLKSPDFFDVENFPEMTLVSRGVKKDGDDVMLLADVTIRGVTKEAKFRVDWGGVMTGFAGTPTTGLTLEGKVNRKDFGMVWNKSLDTGGVVLGDEVKVVVQLEANVPPPEQAGAES